MDERELTERFEACRPRLRAVAQRMLGSATEAEDAVQEAWIALSRSDAAEIHNLEAWLVTVVGRVALNMLRSRRTRREEPLGERLPDPIVEPAGDPEQEALLADSVGLALLVVLETLTPAERLAYVLHDMFAVPFEQIAGILERSPDAVRQLASRGRRRIRSADTVPDAAAQAEVVDAFLAAARHGEFDALVAVLDPDVVLREDSGTGALLEVRGAEAVARRAKAFSQICLAAWPVLVNGAPGWMSARDGEPYAVAAITVRDGRIATMDIVGGAARLARLGLTSAAPPR
jgi:RNA polymerase sigma factor (sigma-70 family)